MEVSVHVLCRPELAAAFEVAGIAVDAAAPERAGEALLQLASRPEVGVVLIDEQLHQALPAELLQKLAHQSTPIVAPFPSSRWDRRGAAEAYVLEILRQAIGYRVRPR